MKEKIPFTFFESSSILASSRLQSLWFRFFCKYTLLWEKDKQIAFIENELERTIDKILDKIEGVQLPFMMYDANKNMTKPNAKLFCKHFSEGIFWSANEIDEYLNVVAKLGKLKGGFFDKVKKEELVKVEISFLREMILELPRMADFLEGFALFTHLDRLYEMIERTKSKELITTYEQIQGSLILDIQSEFDMIDKKGWEYVFFNESDYKKFVFLLNSFLLGEFKEVDVELIKTKPRCKTKLASTLGSIYLSKFENLNSNKEFIKLVRVFEVFSDVPDKQLYDALKRK
ncbi:hypothetical protein J1N10_19965 [Carboxylicivirga sp. A043]|uniref:hypothetical protein n=1 Tax=Carboxylicivirga litoralis TaxID=2816963 RepID=UPI0021CAF72D|nr:hypothetical protein [Carboxylicivirga sp. A043]MCU4158260.1 hypothetical protein [Carboxylicivirga sp. A043]